MPYRCRQNTFTQEQYDRRAGYFCPIPKGWGRLPGPTTLAQLKRLGGTGSLSIYPVLGQFTHSSFADHVRYAKEEIARLTSRDVRTVRRGAKALAELGLVTETQGWYLRQPITQWSIQQDMAAQRGPNGLEDYFYFSSRLIYGGAWAMLTAVQQALFLAVGTNCVLRYHHPADDYGLLDALRLGTNILDLERCYEHTRSQAVADGQQAQPFIRVAILSYSQLAEITAISESALKRAVKQLKHPDLWAASSNDPSALRYSPLAVYPTGGGALLYHVRDHAPHWPWDDLNRSPQRVTAATVGGATWDDDAFPF